MTAAPAPAAQTIEDIRNYGSGITDRLSRALDAFAPLRADPRHANLFVVQHGRDNFYISPLPSGKILLLAYWRG